MALPSDTTSPDVTSKVFQREVDEELRREQIANLWARHGGAIVVGILGLLVLVGAGLWWNAHRAAGRGEAGEQLQAAFDRVEAGDAVTAAADLAPIATSGNPAYRSLARLAQANLRVEAHDVPAAARAFASVAADGDAAQPFRDLALVRETATRFDALKPELVVQRLRALAVPGNAFFGSAGEMVGLAYLRMNRRDLAATLFNQIAADDGAPPSIRQRAVQMASVLASTTAPQAAAPRPTPDQDKPAR